MKLVSSLLLCGTVASSAHALDYKTEGSLSRPNIIFILTDDQPIGYMGFEGNPVVKTPNFDALARDGVYFSNAYITSPICTPSRASILTGQFERKHGVNFNSGTSLNNEAWELTYPMLLRKAGYYTGYIGKNHTPVGNGGYESGLMEESFDYWYAAHGALSFYPKDISPIFRDAKYDTQVEIIEEGVNDFFSNEHNLNNAIKFIDQRPAEKPFCLSISFNLPHDAGARSMDQRPTDKEIYKSLYRDVDIPLPPNYVAKADIVTPKIPELIHRFRDRQTGYNYVDNPIDLRERYIRKYQAMTGVDEMIGKLRTVLSDKGLDKNTIIIFTSDHGQFMGQFGLGGKALCYQVCTKVPMIIYDPFAPKHARGKVIDELVQAIDIAPTMLTLAGLNVPDEMQGKNILPMLKGDITPIREYLFTENLWSTPYGNPRIEAVQNKEWKYIRYYKNDNISARDANRIAREIAVPANIFLQFHDPHIVTYRGYIESTLNGEPAVFEELYNLKNDPEETTNLIGNQSYSDVLQTMKDAWWQMLNEARGDGPPKVFRYTIDSRAE